MKVVIRYFDIFNNYSICHAKSYQNAFRSEVNSFKTYKDALKFCRDNGCVVEHHAHDRLQHI